MGLARAGVDPWELKGHPKQAQVLGQSIPSPFLKTSSLFLIYFLLQITEKEMVVEEKGVDSYSLKTSLNVAFATNYVSSPMHDCVHTSMACVTPRHGAARTRHVAGLGGPKPLHQFQKKWVGTWQAQRN